MLQILFPLILLSDFFLTLSNFFTHMSCSVLFGMLEAGASADLWGVDSVQLSPDQHVPGDFQHRGSVAFSSIPAVEGDCWAASGSLSLSQGLGWLRRRCGGRPEAHLVCCSLLRDQITFCHFMSNVLKTVSYIFSCFPCGFRQEDKCSPWLNSKLFQKDKSHLIF